MEKTNVMDFRIAYASTIHNIIPGINDYENICNITGLEKPTIGIDEKGVYWYFVDSTILDHITDPNSGDYQDPFFMDDHVFSSPSRSVPLLLKIIFSKLPDRKPCPWLPQIRFVGIHYILTLVTEKEIVVYFHPKHN